MPNRRSSNGVAPFPSKALSPFSPTCPFFGLACSMCSLALGFAFGALGRECCSVVLVGARISLSSSPPALVGSGFVLRKLAVAPCDSRFRLRGGVVAAIASCFFGALMRRALSCSNRRKSVDAREFSADLRLRRGPLTSLVDFTSSGRAGLR